VKRQNVGGNFVAQKMKKNEKKLFFANIINILFLQFYQNKRDGNGFNSRFDWKNKANRNEHFSLSY
jgi:hypothetical protein